MLVLEDGRTPATEFLQQFTAADRRYFRLRKRLESAVALLADRPPGRFIHREAFKKVEDNLFEFKAWQLRLLCFFVRGGRVILLDGVIKKGDDLDSADLRRARAMRDGFLRTLELQQGSNTHRRTR